jgi:hypothetical protein
MKIADRAVAPSLPSSPLRPSQGGGGLFSKLLCPDFAAGIPSDRAFGFAELGMLGRGPAAPPGRESRPVAEPVDAAAIETAPPDADADQKHETVLHVPHGGNADAPVATPVHTPRSPTVRDAPEAAWTPVTARAGRMAGPVFGAPLVSPQQALASAAPALGTPRLGGDAAPTSPALSAPTRAAASNRPSASKASASETALPLARRLEVMVPGAQVTVARGEGGVDIVVTLPGATLAQKAEVARLAVALAADRGLALRRLVINGEAAPPPAQRQER